MAACSVAAQRRPSSAACACRLRLLAHNERQRGGTMLSAQGEKGQRNGAPLADAVTVAGAQTQA